VKVREAESIARVLEVLGELAPIVGLELIDREWTYSDDLSKTKAIKPRLAQPMTTSRKNKFCPRTRWRLQSRHKNDESDFIELWNVISASRNSPERMTLLRKSNSLLLIQRALIGKVF
jgi:hypothetical protein